MKPSDDPIVERIWNVPTDETAAHLFVLGSFLASAELQRTSRLDSKLSSVMGWSIALVGFLLVSIESWLTQGGWLVVAMVVTLAVALAATVLSYLAIRSRSEWLWISEKDWLKADLLDQDLTAMQRFHIIALMEVLRSNRKINFEKAKLAADAQFALACAAFLAGLAIVLRLLLAAFPSGH